MPHGADEPPPITDFALRHRLVRPRHDRKIVGVCAGLGAATGTDPVLWRVVVTVLTLFGGVGLLAYIVGWLAMPQEGDEVAAVESLVGRGRSSTSPLLTVLLGVAGIGLIFFVFGSGFRFTVLVAAVAVTVAVLLTRRNQARAGVPPAYRTTGPPGAAAPPGYQPGSPTPTGWPQAGPAAGQGQAPYPGGWTVPPTGRQEPAHHAPFAPHGPYEPSTAASSIDDEVPLAGWPHLDDVPPPPPPPAPPHAPRARQPRERSLLGRLTLFTLLIVLGLLALVAATGHDIPASAFAAVGLAVVGTGLVVGARRGRARWLIALGCVFAVALPASWAGEHIAPHQDWRSHRELRNQHWTPAAVTDVRSSYHTDVGDAVLDLRGVDFSGQARSVSIDTGVGNVRVLLPPDVDTVVRTSGGFGTTDVFGTHDQGPRDDTGPVTDLGADGKGGGQLTLDVRVPVGNVEVTR